MTIGTTGMRNGTTGMRKTTSHHHRDNGQLVYLDSNNLALGDPLGPLALQIQRGVVYADLPGQNGQLPGQFLLNPGDAVPPCAPSALNVAMPSTAPLPCGGARILAHGLEGILGQPRIWMLYSRIQGQGGISTLSVVGFVVAR